MVRRTSGSGSGEGSVNIVIKATDKASKDISGTATAMSSLTGKTKDAAVMMRDFGLSAISASVKAVGAIGTVAGAINNLFNLLTGPIAQTVWQTFYQLTDNFAQSMETVQEDLTTSMTVLLETVGVRVASEKGRLAGSKFTTGMAETILDGTGDILAQTEKQFNEGLKIDGSLPNRVKAAFSEISNALFRTSDKKFKAFEIEEELEALKKGTQSAASEIESIGAIAGDRYGDGFFGSLLEAFKRAIQILTDPVEYKFSTLEIEQEMEALKAEIASTTEQIEEAGQEAGRAYGGGMSASLRSSLASAVNQIDGFLASARSAVEEQLADMGNAAGNVGNVLFPASGADDILKVFNAYKGAVGQVSGSIFSVVQEIGFFEQGIQSLMGIVSTGPFQMLIGQNARLRAELLATQSSLAATNEVLAAGVELADPTAAIQALEGPVNAAVAKIRRDSLDLVGVTSKELVSVFNILSSQISGVGGDLNDASDLTIDFAAALGTLQIPLEQARQEINSILMGQVTSDSYLAKSIGLTNAQLQLWRQQNTVVTNLRDKLSAFTAGNALAAKSLDGVSSNIQEVFDEVFRRAGEPLLDPIVEQLNEFYEYLQANMGGLEDFIGQIVDNLLVIWDSLVYSAKEIGGALQGIAGDVTLFLFESLAKAATGFANGLRLVMPYMQPFVELLDRLGDTLEAVNPLFTFVVSLKLLEGGLKAVSSGFSTLGYSIPIVGEALTYLDIRGNSVLSTFINTSQLLKSLTGTTGGYSAAVLTFTRHLNKIPGAMQMVTGQLNQMLTGFGAFGQVLTGFTPQIAQMIPMVSTVSIGLLGLMKNSDAMRGTLNAITSALPNSIGGLANLADRASHAGGVFSVFAPVLRQTSDSLLTAADKTKQFTNAESLLTMVNEKLTGVVNKNVEALKNKALNYGVAFGAAFALAWAVNELIIKNEAFADIIEGVSNIVKTVGGDIISFLKEPVVLAVIALGSLVALIQTGVLPALFSFISAQAAAFKTKFADKAIDIVGSFKNIGSSAKASAIEVVRAKVTETQAAIAAETKSVPAMKKLIAAKLGAATASKQLIKTNAVGTLNQIKASSLEAASASKQFAAAQLSSAKSATVNAFNQLKASLKEIAKEFLAAARAAWANAKTTAASFKATAIQAQIAAAATAQETATHAQQSVVIQSSTLPSHQQLIAAKLSSAAASVKLAATNAPSNFLATAKAAQLAAKSIFAVVKAQLLVAKNAAWDALKRLYSAFLAVGAAAIQTAKQILAAATLENAKSAWLVFRGAILQARAAMALARKEMVNMGVARLADGLAAGKVAAKAAGKGITALGESFKAAGIAAKSMLTQLGPIALGIAAIAATVEVVRILHDEFFAGNKVLEEYLENLRDAETKLKSVEAENQVDSDFREGPAESSEVKRLQEQLAFYQAEVKDERGAVTKVFDTIRSQNAKNIEGQLEFLIDLEKGQASVEEAKKVYRNYTGRSITGTDEEILEAAREVAERNTANYRELNAAVADQGELFLEADSRTSEEYKTRLNQYTVEMERLVDAYNAKSISEEEFAEESGKVNKKIEAAQEAIETEISELESKTAVGDQVALKAGAIRELRRLQEELANVNPVTTAQKDLPELGTAYDQLTQSVTQARAAIEEGKGEPSVIAGRAKELLDGTQTLLEQNIILEEEALSNLRTIATSTTLDKELVQQAQTAITKIIQGQSKERLDIMAGEKAAIELQARDGAITEIQSQQRITAVVKREGQERLDALRAQYDEEKAIRDQQQADSVAALETQLDEIQQQIEANGGRESPQNEQLLNDEQVLLGQLQGVRDDFRQQELQSQTEYNAQVSQTSLENQKQLIEAENQLYQLRLKLLQDAQDKALDAVKSAQTAADIQIQELVNAGELNSEEAAQRRAATAIAATEAELEAERIKLEKLENLPKPTDPQQAREYEAQLRAQRLKTAGLTKTLLEQERSLIEANIALIENKLASAARDYGTEIEAQNQLLTRQNTLNDQLTKGLEIRSNLLSAQQNLSNAAASFVQGELDVLSQTTQSEYRKQQIAQATAAIKYQMALMENEYAMKSLELELEQNRLARERELTENRIAILKADQAVQQGANDIAVAQEKYNAGLISEGELNAVVLEQQGNILERQGLIEQRGYIQQQAAVDEVVGESRREQLEYENRGRTRQAQLALAQSLPPGLQQRALRGLGDEIASDFGYDSQADLINSGVATARGLAGEQFGTPRSVGRLSAYDPEMEGLAENLSPSQRRALEADTQQRYQSQFGAFGQSGPFADQGFLGAGADELQLPSELEAGLAGGGDSIQEQIDAITGQTDVLETSAQSQIDAIATQTTDINTDTQAVAAQAQADAANIVDTTMTAAEAQAESAANAIAEQTDEMMTGLEELSLEGEETTNALVDQTEQVVSATNSQTEQLATGLSNQTTDMQLTMLDGFQALSEAVGGLSGNALQGGIDQEGQAQAAGSDLQRGVSAASDALAQWGAAAEEPATPTTDFDTLRAEALAKEQERNAAISGEYDAAREQQATQTAQEQAAIEERRSARPEYVGEREQPALRFEATDQRELTFSQQQNPQAFAESQDRVVQAIQQNGQGGNTYSFEINVSTTGGGGSEAQSVAEKVRDEVKKVLDRAKQISYAQA